MPAKNPRISITVKPSTVAVLRRLSELTNESTSHIIADVLEQSMPVFERVVTVLDAAKKAKEKLTQEHVANLESAEKEVLGYLDMTLDLFDSTTQPILVEAEAISRRKGKGTPQARRGDVRSAPPAALAVGQPPYVTRGSGTPKRAKGTRKAVSSAPVRVASKASKTASKALKPKGRG